MAYRTLAPLVLVKVPGAGDDYRVDYHYAGSIIPWLSDTQRKRFIDGKFVEEIGDAPADEAEAVDGDIVTEAPPKVAPLAAWIAYAISKGFSKADAESKTKQELIDALS
jgi:hypothetical protein